MEGSSSVPAVMMVIVTLVFMAVGIFLIIASFMIFGISKRVNVLTDMVREIRIVVTKK